MSKRNNGCPVEVWIDPLTGLMGGKGQRPCGRPVPCLIHTAYQPEFPPRAGLGPHVAVPAEVCA